MAKPIVTRTMNPLPFGDLEPKRFEDLVRALTYDFRRWRTLEATGRSGSDRGYDARGFEIVEGSPSGEEIHKEEQRAVDVDRIWLIQCKREIRIGPSLAKSHLADVDIKSDNVYGMIFAAACDFSLATREVIRSWARDKGILEIYIWGKGELEDLIRQPKNDYLLFTFFGISMQIKKRSLQNELRSTLVMKRKCVRLLNERKNQFVLVRDYTDERYPYPKEDDPDQSELRWSVVKYRAIIHQGVIVSVVEHHAYIGDDGESWDALEGDNLAAPFEHDNFWHNRNGGRERGKSYFAIWNALPHSNKALYHLDRVIPFSSIIDIDENGDQYARFPHIYIDSILNTTKRVHLSGEKSYDHRSFKCDPEKRVDFFSKLISEQEAGGAKSDNVS